jgi:hypothetical protein
MAEATHLKIVSGDVEVERVATPDEIIQDRSSRLSGADGQRLYRIRKDRANKFMVSVTDVDFLLEIIERMKP